MYELQYQDVQAIVAEKHRRAAASNHVAQIKREAKLGRSGLRTAPFWSRRSFPLALTNGVHTIKRDRWIRLPA